MKAQRLEQITKHGENLNAIFNTGLDPVTLCKKLRRLENKATILTTHECNTGESKYPELCKILTSVKKILFPDGLGSSAELYKAVFINGDPRGYALKISDKYVRERQLRIYSDMGGYGILAPAFN